MGFFVIGDESIGLPVDLPIAFLPRHCFFQKWKVWHIGIRTGFLGSLTTFASWNTQMVVMLCGGSRATAVGSSQWFTALFGYIIGLATSLACYQAGIHAALVTHRRFNKDLAKEADVLYERIGTTYNFCYDHHNEPIYRDLPDFERNFFLSISRLSILQNEKKPGSSRGRESIHRDLPNSERRFLHDIHDEHAPDEAHSSYIPPRHDADENEAFEHDNDTHVTSQTNYQPLTENTEMGVASTDTKMQHDLYTESDNGNDTKSTDTTTQKEHERQSLIQTNSSRLPTNNENIDNMAFHHLQRWKETTNKHRKGLVDNGGTFQKELQEIERVILIDNTEPREDLLNIAQILGWDVDALRSWKRSREEHHDDTFIIGARNDNDVDKTICSDLEFILSLLLFIILTSLLLWGAIVIDFRESVTNKTSKTFLLAALLAPPGAILRWQLSKLNGYNVNNPKWEWVPFGTLAANLIASIISALSSAIELRFEDDDLLKIWMGALRTGFAGSLSTVSTFAAETHGLMRLLPRKLYGYYYSIGSLVLACILGVASYVWAI
uniref:Fluoride ion transporter CrcB n=1 Tax=Ditylum brightwellii TaxID=49249 RepID=A0A7S4VXX3_9STRA